MANPSIYAVDLSQRTFTASGSDASFPVTNLNDGFEADLWKAPNANNNSYVTTDLGAGAPASNFVILSGNYRSLTSVVFQRDVAAAPDNPVTIISGIQGATRVAQSSVADLYTFTAVAARYFRMTFTTTGGTVPALGQFFVGASLDFPGSYDWGFKRITPVWDTKQVRNLDGSLRASRAYGGHRKWELSFSFMSDTLRAAIDTFLTTVDGQLRAFYFLDYDGSLWYVQLVMDVTPVDGYRYNINNLKSLVFEEQLSSV